MDLKAKLLNRALPTDYIDIPDVGKVQVRGLSRDEVLGVPDERVARDHWVVVHGLVDPQLTEDEVADWFKVAISDEVQEVVHKILDLSGLLEDSAKRAYKSAGDGSGS